MAIFFTYDTKLPTDQDWVRFLTGDTRASDVELDDFEIQTLLADEPDPEPEVAGEEVTAEQWRAYRHLVAARAAEAIAAKHARDSDTSFDNQRVGLSAKFKQYRDLAKELRLKASGVDTARSIRVIELERA